MRFLIVMLSVGLSLTTFAQTDLSSLPVYDCSLTKVMAMIAKPTIIVTADNSKGLEPIVADYCGTIGNNCIRKKESDLTAADLQKNLFFIGVLKEFSHWRKYNTAVTQTDKGFIVNDHSFQNVRDGFVFVDTNRIVIAGNSLQAVKDAQLAFTGGHDILITQNGRISFFGNKKGKGFYWYNLPDLKQTNYIKKSSELFSAIYVSKKYHDTIDYRQLNKELKLYVQQFSAVYQISLPAKKVNWLLHTDMKEYGTMSGLFGLTCPGNSSGGFSIRGEIHTYGFNTLLVKHEYSHYLFDNAIPQDNNPAFFVEGAVEYVAGLNDKTKYTKRIQIAQKYIDSIPYQELIIKNQNFYGPRASENYSICGVFVKYLIDNYGVNAFKKYCLAADKSVAAEKIFRVSFEVIVDQYKNWLLKQ